MTEFKPLALIRNCCELLGDKFTGHQSEIIMAAIAFQESNFEHRRQKPGPARGFWQFERIGVQEVMQNPASWQHAQRIAKKRNIAFDSAIIHPALERDDILAGCFARLLLWTDRRPLPTTLEAGWEYYIRNWKPGKPHKHRWLMSWEQAQHLCKP